MSIPAPPQAASHHSYQSWSSFWREDGRKQCKRFGKVGEVSKAVATARYWTWFNGQYKARLDAKARRTSEAATNGEPVADVGTFTVRRLCLAYAEVAKDLYTKNGKLTSHIDQVEHALNAMMENYGDKPADDIGAPEVATLIEGMIDSTNRHGEPVKLTTSTINGRLRIIKQAYAWGRTRGLVNRLAAVDVSLVKPLRPGRCKAKAPKNVKPVALDVLEATLAECPQTVADMARVQLLTGMRPGELCAMRPCDIDGADKTCWVYRPQTHKTEHKGKLRAVPIGEKAQAILKPYIDRRRLNDPVFLPEEAHRERLERIGFEKVMAYQTSRSRFKPGRAFRADTYRNKLQYACDRAFDADGKLRAARDYGHRWHPHQLRHNYATSVRAEFGIEAAADVLGHTSLNTTLIYAERSLARAKDVARKVG